MSEQMLSFSEINWVKLITTGESPIDFCLRKEIPAYFRVNKDRQRVRYQYRLLMGLRHFTFQHVEKFSLHDTGWKTGRRILLGDYPVEAFHADLLFLRIDDYSLAVIARSSRSVVSAFLENGFSIPRPFRAVGRGPRGHEIREYEKIKKPTLEKVEFERAFLVDKERWESIPLIPPEGSRHAPEEFTISVDVCKSDLWFAAIDIEAMKHEAQEGRELAPYPYAHKDRMPGIYWMFQAAYALNERETLTKKEVREWLNKMPIQNPYRYRSVRTAEKFVWPWVDRAKGSTGRGEFNLDDLDEWTCREPYEFPFVSKGLTCIFAIADWWVKMIGKDPNTTTRTLAERLDESQFAGLEIGDLVYLISGSQITEGDNALFGAYLKKNGKRVVRIIDGPAKNASSAD